MRLAAASRRLTLPRSACVIHDVEPTRREIVQLIAALGFGAAAATEVGADAPPGLSTRDIQGALAIQRREVSDGEVERLQPALQRSLADVQRIRELEISDDVALPVVFGPRRL